MTMVKTNGTTSNSILILDEPTASLRLISHPPTVHTPRDEATRPSELEDNEERGCHI